MRKLSIVLLTILLYGCVSFVSHPISGEQIAVPPNMNGKIDFDLTILYKSEIVTDGINGKVISQFENSGIVFELTSLDPLLGKTVSKIQLGDIIREATTFVTLNVKELEKGSYTFTITPTYGGARAGTTQKWILLKSKEYLVAQLDKILNPLGYFRVFEKPLLLE